MGLQHALDALIAADKPILLQLRNTNQPMGPGKCVRLTTIHTAPDGSETQSHVYRMMCPATMQTTPQSRPQKMIQPLVFDAADILLIYEETLNADGEKASIPTDGKGSGGLIIPGRG